LDIHKNTIVTNISPGDLLNGGIGEPQSVPLISAVLEWLEYMGVVKDVETVDRGKLGHELKVIVDGGSAFHDLTNVGVGVSQVLPILVLSLLAEKGSTLIFEQPELHLHPKVQTRLADFLVSMMLLKKQCIVESHSEYLINRLRYRSVISEDDIISENVMIYFVEKENGKSKYKQVKINKFGVIEEWPKGFFDENEENSAAILRAAMNKRKKGRKLE
jgi:predicted ATPase